ncbi:neuropeptide F receptor-like [Oratosquilla oratoria]|uniref:neuropeptide F receptor-like n=1 Tax=Oratosquilla oratoria TaxID=337810 RepID=UPI003F7647B4
MTLDTLVNEPHGAFPIFVRATGDDLTWAEGAAAEAVVAAVAEGEGEPANSVSVSFEDNLHPAHHPVLPDFAILAGLEGDNLTDLFQNLTLLLNLTGGINPNLIDKFNHNRSVDKQTFCGLIVSYAVLVILGTTGNILVVTAVARKPAMRTARNVFIVNLATSDILLCLVTTPLTLMELLTQYWPLGYLPFTCKMVGSLQATSIYVSTISITAIALDRYQVIVYPTKPSLKKFGAVAMLLCIWVLAVLLALPNFIWRTLKHHDINLPNLKSVDFCFEDWPTPHGRGFYSLFVILLQYCVPILTVSTAYAKIYKKLKYRMPRRTSTKNERRKSTERQEDNRRRRTNILLVSIALIFGLSWLPLNLFNVIVDFHNPFEDNTQMMVIIYAVCHMIGMSSACSNPLLYGWLNDNFRKEFHEIFHLILPCWLRHKICVRVKYLKSEALVRLGGYTDQNTVVNDDDEVEEISIQGETNGSAGRGGRLVVMYSRCKENVNIVRDLQDSEFTYITQLARTPSP